MIGLIVAVLCLAGLVAIGRVLLRAHRADKGLDGRPSPDRTAAEVPRRTAPSQAQNFVSERRVACGAALEFAPALNEQTARPRAARRQITRVKSDRG